MTTVLVTGAGGFVGKHLVPVLAGRGWTVRTVAPGKMAQVGPSLDWSQLLDGVDAVVHLAARVHVMERGPDPSAHYEKSNVALTAALARAALKAGTRRFIYLSSVKALGEKTPDGWHWDEDSPCDPQDAYGRSKRDAERVLAGVQADGLGVTVLRAPLLYGPGVGANMERLMRAVLKGLPLPLANVRNKRSFLYVGNLAEALLVALEHDAAPRQTFLVSDGEDLSTPDLIRRFAKAAGRTPRLLPCPPSLLRWAAAALGKTAQAERLLDSLVVDSSKIRQSLGWKPPYCLDQGLALTARWLHSG